MDFEKRSAGMSYKLSVRFTYTSINVCKSGPGTKTSNSASDYGKVAYILSLKSNQVSYNTST